MMGSIVAASSRPSRCFQEPSRDDFVSRRPFEIRELFAIFRLRQRSAKIFSLALQRDAIRLEIAHRPVHLLMLCRAGGIASRRESLRMHHEREAITGMGMAPRLTRHRPVQERRRTIAMLLQRALDGGDADSGPLRDRRIAEKAIEVSRAPIGTRGADDDQARRGVPPPNRAPFRVWGRADPAQMRPARTVGQPPSLNESRLQELVRRTVASSADCAVLSGRPCPVVLLIPFAPISADSGAQPERVTDST